MIDFRHLARAQPTDAKQFVDFRCVVEGEEFASRVGPAIFDRAGDVDRSRR